MLIDWTDFWVANNAPYGCFVCGERIKDGDVGLIESGWVGGSFSIPDRSLYFHPNCLELFCKNSMNEIRRLRKKSETGRQ